MVAFVIDRYVHIFIEKGPLGVYRYESLDSKNRFTFIKLNFFLPIEK